MKNRNIDETLNELKETITTLIDDAVDDSLSTERFEIDFGSQDIEILFNLPSGNDVITVGYFSELIKKHPAGTKRWAEFLREYSKWLENGEI